MKTTLFFLALSLNAITAFAHDPSALFPLSEIEVAGQDIVADTTGHVVYTYDHDEAGISNCYGICAKAWPPVLVATADGIKTPMGVTKRKTGELQVTIDNKPLYFYKGDSKPGETNGDGLGNIWHIVQD